MQLALSPQESTPAAPATEARRHHQHQDPVPHVNADGHAHRPDEGVLKWQASGRDAASKKKKRKKKGGNLDLGI